MSNARWTSRPASSILAAAVARTTRQADIELAAAGHGRGTDLSALHDQARAEYELLFTDANSLANRQLIDGQRLEAARDSQGHEAIIRSVLVCPCCARSGRRSTAHVRSSLGHPAQIEVIDRVPVGGEADVEVSHSARPEAHPYDQAERGRPVKGGLAWSLELPPAGETRVELRYRVKIPVSSELVGGNRRE